MTAQEINYSELGRDINITHSTAKAWIQTLVATYQWQEVWPFTGNMIKRVSKRRKGYLADTGIACFLLRIGSPIALASHPMLGALYETMCVNTILKLLEPLNIGVNTYHWHISQGAEVDLILEKDAILYPIEFKCRSWIKQSDTRGIKAFKETYPHLRVAPGVVIYAGKECYRINEHAIALPWNADLS